MKRLIRSWVVIFFMTLFVCNNTANIQSTNSASSVLSYFNYICRDMDKRAFENKLKKELLDVKIIIETAEDNAENIELLDDDIEEEKRLGQMELLAQLIEAEAGNQDFKGKRLVADVVINRAHKKSNLDPTNAVESIIFETGQFSCIKDGGFEKAGWNISEESFKAAEMEYNNYYNIENLLDSNIIFFTAGCYNPYCKPLYRHGDHYFGM